MFIKFANIEVKVVIDRQPLLGTGLLPDWLHNFAQGCQMVGLDTYNDNLCLWCCTAVHQGALPHRSTQATRELAKGYFKLREAPNDVPETLLELNWIRL